VAGDIADCVGGNSVCAGGMGVYFASGMVKNMAHR